MEIRDLTARADSDREGIMNSAFFRQLRARTTLHRRHVSSLATYSKRTKKGSRPQPGTTPITLLRPLGGFAGSRRQPPFRVAAEPGEGQFDARPGRQTRKLQPQSRSWDSSLVVGRGMVCGDRRWRWVEDLPLWNVPNAQASMLHLGERHGERDRPEVAASHSVVVGCIWLHLGRWPGKGVVATSSGQRAEAVPKLASSV